MMHKRKALQFKAMAKDPSMALLPGKTGKDKDGKDLEGGQAPAEIGDKGLPHIHSMDRLSSASNFKFGQSIQSAYHKNRAEGTFTRPDSEMVNTNNYTIRSVERVFSAFPQKKPKKDKKALEEEKAKQAEEEALLKAMPRNETNQ